MRNPQQVSKRDQFGSRSAYLSLDVTHSAKAGVNANFRMREMKKIGKGDKRTGGNCVAKVSTTTETGALFLRMSACVSSGGWAPNKQASTDWTREGKKLGGLRQHNGVRIREEGAGICDVCLSWGRGDRIGWDGDGMIKSESLPYTMPTSSCRSDCRA